MRKAMGREGRTQNSGKGADEEEKGVKLDAMRTRREGEVRHGEGRGEKLGRDEARRRPYMRIGIYAQCEGREKYILAPERF